jgi:hypothetical protein
MKTLLKNIFISNWPRKCLSIILAVVIWFVVNKSLTTTKMIPNVPVKIKNIPPGKTVADIQSNGVLTRRINLTITGNKSLLEDLTSNDIEVVFDASDKEGEWIATISKQNIQAENPDVNISQGISKVVTQNFLIKLTNLVTEKIPIIITHPIGEAPKGYQFLDIWPYQLYITISGPEDTVKKLKSRGLQLTFNLNDISKAALDDLHTSPTSKNSDVVSYFIPNHWKLVSLPVFSPVPLEINDPEAKFLRIDFVRHELLKIDSAVPVSLYFPPNKLDFLHPQRIHLAQNELLENQNGMKIIKKPLYAKGVSSFFLEIIKDLLQIVVIVNSKENAPLDWSLQFINGKILEDRYVHILMSDASDEEIHDLQPRLRERYLRNRFRSYMNRLELFSSDNEKLELSPILQGNTIILQEKKTDGT